MYTSLVDVSNISPALIIKLLGAAETYQVVCLALMCLMPSDMFDVKSCKYLQGGDGERGTGRSAHGGNRNRDRGKLIEFILNRNLL